MGRRCLFEGKKRLSFFFPQRTNEEEINDALSGPIVVSMTGDVG